MSIITGGGEMLKRKIAFIGPGVMAEAMLVGLLRQGLAEPAEITVAGPRAERGKELADRYGINSVTDNGQAASSADIVVLSVKPQRLSEVMKGLKAIRPECRHRWRCAAVAAADRS